MLEFAVHFAIIAAIYGLLALSLNLQMGFAGLINFGHIAFFACGTYGLGIATKYGCGNLAGVILAICFAVALASAFARLGRRLDTDYLGIASLAVAEIIRIVVTNEVWLTGGAQGISGIQPLFGTMSGLSARLLMAVLCWSLLIMTFLAFRWLAAGAFGRALKLVREEPILARSFGYDVDKLKKRTLVLSSIPAAAAGYLFASYFTFVGPDQILPTDTLLIWAMVVIGGLGSHMGAVCGSLLILGIFTAVPFLKDVTGAPTDTIGAIRLALVGCTLLAFLLWRQEGLIPEKIESPKHG